MRIKRKEYYVIQKYLITSSFMVWRYEGIKILSQSGLGQVGSINTYGSRGRMLVALEKIQCCNLMYYWYNIPELINVSELILTAIL